MGKTLATNSNCLSVISLCCSAGTREVHNKLEKNRRAQLKGCYEELKKELPLRDEDRKKTSNLNILDKAHKFVLVRSPPHVPSSLSEDSF